MTQQFMNRIELVGRVGQDPTTHYFDSGAMKTTLTKRRNYAYRGCQTRKLLTL